MVSFYPRHVSKGAFIVLQIVKAKGRHICYHLYVVWRLRMNTWSKANKLLAVIYNF